MHNNLVSIIIPAFNEAAGIKNVVLTLAKLYPKYEILVIDDGSTDKTADIARELPCRVISHKKNKGYGASWKTGIQEAKNEIIVFFDGDSQFDPHDVKRLLEAFHDDEADMVSGSRSKTSHVPFERRPLKKILKWFVQILIGQSIEDLNCGLRCLRRSSLAQYAHLLPDGFSASTTSLVTFLYLKKVVTFIPIHTSKRVGKSSVKVIYDGMGTVMLIIRLVALFNPLKIFLPLSIFFLVSSTSYSLYEAFLNKMGIPILGAMVFILGILTFFFGILCDQIAALRLYVVKN